MKLSKRNIERMAREQERLAAGKPSISKYEAKYMTEDERRERLMAAERELATSRRLRKGVIG